MTKKQLAKRLRRYVLMGFPFLTVGSWPRLLLANDCVQTGGSVIGVTNPINACDFATLLADILRILVQIGTPILVIAIVYVGFLFISARGNPTKITEAKSALMWTLIGAAIVIGAQAIAIIIQSTMDTLS